MVNIKYPLDIKDWRHYMPDLSVKKSNKTTKSLGDVVKLQNKFHRLITHWKRNVETNYHFSFSLCGFNYEETNFKDFSLSSKYVIANLKAKDLFFAVYLEERFVQYLISHSFESEDEKKVDIQMTPMEQLLIKKFFSDTLFSSINANFDNKCDFDINLEIGNKEKNKLINDMESFNTLEFIMQLPSITNRCSMVFSFTDANLKVFNERFNLSKDSLRTISLSDNACSKIKTGVKVLFGEVVVSLGELQKIRYGDVLLMKKNIGEQVTVEIGGEIHLKADLGIKNNNLAVKLVALAERDCTLANNLENDTLEDELFSENLDEVADEDLLENDSDSSLEENAKENAEDEFDWENL